MVILCGLSFICSCINQTNKTNAIIWDDNIPDSAIVFYKDTLNDTLRTIYIVKKEYNLKSIFIHISGQVGTDKELHLKYDRYSDGNNIFEDGLPYSMYYIVSPDKRYIYVVTSVGACGSGFLTEHQLFRINVQTLSCIMIKDCVTVSCNKDGFVMTQGYITNEETATTTTAFEYEFYFEYYDWSSKFVRKETKQPVWIPDDYEKVLGFKRV